MKYFYDTEFIEDGKTIDLISIGIVAEDGREYYAVNSDMPIRRILKNAWLMENVVPSLPSKREVKKIGPYEFLWELDDEDTCVKPHWVIRNEVREFMAIGDEGDPKAEMWADYGAYDHVVLAQLFGRMIDLPEWIPMYTREFQQRLDDLGCPEVLTQSDGLHNALADAKHLKANFEYVAEIAESTL